MEAVPLDASEMPAVGSALEAVKSYPNHADAIRLAMQDDAHVAAALTALTPSIGSIVEWYELSGILSEQLPKGLANLKEDARTVCIILKFILDFDSTKMTTPAIQNDLSFVRRAQSKGAIGIIDATQANLVSMFIAQSSPMLARLAADLDAASLKALATVAALCCAALSDKRLPLEKRETCLVVMTSAFVLYDRASKTPAGAFARDVPFNPRKIALAIKKHGRDRTHVLLGAYRYTTLNFAQHAPTSVRNIVDV